MPVDLMALAEGRSQEKRPSKSRSNGVSERYSATMNGSSGQSNTSAVDSELNVLSKQPSAAKVRYEASMKPDEYGLAAPRPPKTMVASGAGPWTSSAGPAIVTTSASH